MARKPPKGKSLAEVNPELAKEWHPTKNGDLTPFDITYGSGLKVWWKCKKDNNHEWFTSPNRRKNRGCPKCKKLNLIQRNKSINLSRNLAKVSPDIARQWHPTKNGDLNPNDISFGSGKKVWWRCSKGPDHEWFTSANRRKNRGCPFCANDKVSTTNCLANVNPKIAEQWHPIKNGELTPYDVVRGSKINVWWNVIKLKIMNGVLQLGIEKMTQAVQCVVVR